jgi:flagellar biosynthesis GTPase FlhF
MTIKAPEAITQVKRYWWAHDTGRMTPAYEGTNQFVLASDFDTLQSSLERTERELREAKACSADTLAALNKAITEAGNYKAENQRLRKTLARLLASSYDAAELMKDARAFARTALSNPSNPQQPAAKSQAEQMRDPVYVLNFIANAKRFDRFHFDDDTAFADWAQSLARHVIGGPSNPEKGES